jgi:hypothetical protein
MLLTHRDNGVSMGGSLKEVSTLKKLLHFGGPKSQTKLVLAMKNQMSSKSQGRVAYFSKKNRSLK